MKPIWLPRVLVMLILSYVLVFGLWLAKRDSLTTDEGVHIASGYLALTRRDFRFDPEHPFLFKILSAAPLLAIDLKLPPDDQKLWDTARPLTYDSWRESREWADQWFFRSGNDADAMLFWARLASVITLALLCLLVYVLGTLWFSPAVGLFSLALVAFNPTVLAHGHLANDDVPIALAILAGLWAIWWYAKSPGLARASVMGLMIGLALLTKYSGLSLVIIAGAFFFYQLARKTSKSLRLWDLGLALLIAWALIWIAYLGNLHYFFKGFVMVLLSSSLGRPAYLLGEYHLTGFWYYFPVLFFYKTQLSGLLTLVVGAWVFIKNKTIPKTGQEDGREDSQARLLLILSILILGYISLSSKLNIGLRHLLPLMVLLTFLMGIGLTQIKSVWQKGALLGVYVLPVLLQSNNLIGFSNELIYPPWKSYQYFADSNLDWGQGSKDIALAARERFKEEELYLNLEWNPYTLSYYGTQVRAFNPLNPPLGVLMAVSANQLTREEYRPFRERIPIYRLENHTSFYRLQ